ncbi:hypothetical protein D3C80_2052790 [compost metagenome]
MQFDIVSLGQEMIDVLQGLAMQAVGPANPDFRLMQRRLGRLLQGSDKGLQFGEALI